MIDSLMKHYDKMPVMQSLIELICPPFSLLNTILSKKMKKIEEKRIKDLFDNLSKGEHRLTPELISSDEFLHCFFITYEATLKTNRSEKISAFAKLLISCTTEKISNIDEFEDYFKIIEELSWREIKILIILNEFEEPKRNTYTKPDEIDGYNIAESFWNEFIKKASLEANIPENELRGMLMRLARSGCYEIFTLGGFGGASNTNNIGQTTHLFKKLKAIALNELK